LKIQLSISAIQSIAPDLNPNFMDLSFKTVVDC